jgi:hypothetical protein
MMTDQVSEAKSLERGAGTYFCCFGLQALGFGIVLVNGVPIYRQIASDFSHHEPQPGVLWWALGAVLLMQTAYWLRVRWQPALPHGKQILLAHLVAFVGRLSFILGSSTFSVLFLVRYAELSLPPHRVILVLAMLFSIFCFTLELEQLGRSLNGAGAGRSNRGS